MDAETGEPREEVEEALEDGDDIGRRTVRKVAVGVDGRYACFGSGLETSGGFEGVATAIVQKADVLISPAYSLPPEGDFAAVSRGQMRWNPSGLAISQQMLRMHVPHLDDAVRSGVRDPGSARAGIPSRHSLRAPFGAGLQRQDELRSLPGRAALAADDEIDVAAPNASPVVVPYVPIRIDAERGVPVLPEW